MADDGFKGSIIKLEGVKIGKLRSFSYSEDGGDVDVTSLDDDVQVSADGIPAIECTVEIVGTASDIARGAIGDLGIAWNDGTMIDSGGVTFRCSKKDTSGAMGGEVTTSLTFVPTPSVVTA